MVVWGIVGGTCQATDPSKSIELRWKLKPQEEIRYVLAHELTFSSSAAGRKSESTISMKYDLVWEVMDVTKEGTIAVSQTIARVRLQGSPILPGRGNITYDSKDKKLPTDGYAKLLAELAEALHGTTCRINLTPEGRVKAVEFPDDAKKKFKRVLGRSRKKDFQGFVPPSPPLTESGMKRLLQDALVIFPENPLEVGQSWSQKEEVVLERKETLLRTSKYQHISSTKEGAESLEGKISFEFAPDVPPGEETVWNKGSGTTTLLFDNRAGRVRSCRSQQTGTFEQKTRKLRLSMTVESKVTLDLTPTKKKPPAKETDVQPPKRKRDKKVGNPSPGEGSPAPSDSPILLQEKEDGSCYLTAVRTFVEHVMMHGKDVYGDKHTSLFIDGINVDTHQPVQWKRNGEVWILSNLACQQNLFRTMDALSTLTGESKYREIAEQTMRSGMSLLGHETGLLKWGGHVAYDLGSDTTVRADARERLVHELKSHYPYYELAWRVDPQATRKFLEAFWAQHVLDWSNLDFERHGYYRKVPVSWTHDYRDPGEKLFRGRGTTIINAGSELIFAAIALRQLSNDPQPLIWARRLTQRYVDTRHPKTGLGTYWHSRKYPLSRDRAFQKFGSEFGTEATDSTILLNYQLRTRYPIFAIVQMQMGESLGEGGADFIRWGTEDLKALEEHSFDHESATFVPLFANGRRLSPSDARQEDYYKRVHLTPIKAEGMFFWAYAMAFRHTGDKLFWRVTARLGQALGLGALEDPTTKAWSQRPQTTASDPHVLLGLLELHKKTGEPTVHLLARQVADNMIEQRYSNGFFVLSKDHLFANFDAVEPLALLHLVGTLRRTDQRLPIVRPSESYFEAKHDNFKGEFYGGVVHSDEVFFHRKRTTEKK